jgi:hypothetical protein
MGYKKVILYVNKHYPSIGNLLEPFKEMEPPTLLFIKDHVMIQKNYTNTFLQGLIEEPASYDFIISNNSICSKIIRKNENNKDPKTYVFEKSNIKFMLVELSVDDKKYVIDLCKDVFNFYVKDNKLDKPFFLYYLHSLHPDKVMVDEIDFMSVKFIDQNVDIQHIEFSANENQCICFHANGYEIVSL